METAQSNRTLDFIETLNYATSSDEAWRMTTDFMRDFGAGHVGINTEPDGTNPVGQWTTPSWVPEMYLAKVYPDHDPRRDHCRKHLTPYFYGKEFWHREKNLPPPRRRMDEAIADVGIRAGVVIPVHSFSSHKWGFFGVTADLNADRFGRFFARHGTAIHMAGIAAFNRIRSLMHGEQSAAVRITPRERECLLWLGRGFRNEQIADLLNLRPVTVEFHFANAKHKLNARTREQALVNAIQLEIVDP